ncbi:MAG: insulinase family protein [Bacteroidetes bacterium]|nr:MAG: insulinase family protein [Bacteroidota bacterium]
MFKYLLSLIILTSLSFFATAQEQVTIDFKAEVPMDENIRHGVLENGLTYYIRANSTPENRAEFFLINNVGAMQETPGQNGFAHLTEHMCFNGTTNFEKKDIIHYLESIGMKFGPEINAYTVYDQTVYTLNKVPIETIENIDTSLMILFEWATNVTMDTDEINAERLVVREELRTRSSAMSRMRDETNKVLFENSKYAVHNIIGTVDVIDNSPVDTLRAYYNDWYRPDLQAIIIVGDIDVDKMEAKVKEIYSKLPMPKNPKTRIEHQIPNHKGIKVALAQDKEAQYSIIQATYKKDVEKNKNQKYYYEEHLSALYGIMINNRLGEQSQAADAPFMQAFAGYNSMVRTKDAYSCFAVTGNDKIKTGFEAILMENERVKKFGFLESEFDRAKKELLSSNVKAFKERNKRKSEVFASNIKGNYLTNEPIPSSEWDFGFVTSFMEQVKLEEVNALAKEWIVDSNMVVQIWAPEKEDVDMPTEAEVFAIIAKVHSAELVQYVDAEANKPLIARTPVAGTIVSEETKDGITRWTLSNGVKVVIKTTNFKEDEILMRAYSDGGWSKTKMKDDVSAKIAADVVDMSGVGEFDNISLKKKLAGKTVSINPYISQITEGMNGSSSIDDFNTLLKLNYLYFTKPRADKDAFENYKSQTSDQLKNKNSNPQQVFIDSLRLSMSQHHPRKRVMTVDMLNEAKLNRIKYIFGERFGDPSGFTFYFVGNIDIDAQKDTILTYLGGLPTVTREETYTDLGVRMPQSRVENHFTREMETEKATVFIAFTGESKKISIEDELNLQMVKSYLDNRYMETLREEIGGTYGASAWSSISHRPVSEYNIGVYFDADPAKLDTMIYVVYKEMDNLIANGPSELVIKNTVENKLKEHSEKAKENRWWISVIMNDDINNQDYKHFDYDGFWKGITPKSVKKFAKKKLDSKRTVEVVQTVK